MLVAIMAGLVATALSVIIGVTSGYSAAWSTTCSPC
jgi:hypothetical protein